MKSGTAVILNISLPLLPSLHVGSGYHCHSTRSHIRQCKNDRYRYRMKTMTIYASSKQENVSLFFTGCPSRMKGNMAHSIEVRDSGALKALEALE